VIKIAECLFLITLVLAPAATATSIESDGNESTVACMSKILAENDTPAPCLPGDKFKFMMMQAAVNNLGQVAFLAETTHQGSSAFDVGVYLSNGDELISIACFGTPTPVPGHLFRLWGNHRRVEINDAGTVLFVGDIVEDLAHPYAPYLEGIFVYENGALRCLAFDDQIYWASINNRGDVVSVIGHGNYPEVVSGVYLFSGDGMKPLIMPGQPVPNNPGAVFSQFGGAFIDESGNVAFEGYFAKQGTLSRGIFLLSDGTLTKIIQEGDTLPGPDGATFSRDSHFAGLDASGAIIITAQGMLPLPGEPHAIVGVYRCERDVISPIVVRGQELPQANGRKVNSILEPLVSRDIIMMYVDFQDKPYGYTPVIANKEMITPFSYYTNDGQPADPLTMGLSSNGTLVVGTTRGLFLARLVKADSIYTDGFDVAGEDGLPLHWSTAWNNFGFGDSGRYDSSGQDSFDGCCTLRLHTAAGGGATFIVSDSIPARPSQFYRLTAQIRQALRDLNSKLFFSVIQYDDAGNDIAITEVGLTWGDWSWQPLSMLILTSKETAGIKIRFGLVAAAEYFVDIDSLR
jgi:hypothetical protein